MKSSQAISIYIKSQVPSKQESAWQEELLSNSLPLEFVMEIIMGHEGMKYSLSSRELIADSIESMAMAYPFDGLVLIPNWIRSSLEC